MAGGVRLSEIQSPTSDATVSSPLPPFYKAPPSFPGPQDAELAWHFFLPGLASDYMYYGSAMDMPVKQTIACNNAVAHANKSMIE